MLMTGTVALLGGPLVVGIVGAVAVGGTVAGVTYGGIKLHHWANAKKQMQQQKLVAHL